MKSYTIDFPISNKTKRLHRHGRACSVPIAQTRKSTRHCTRPLTGVSRACQKRHSVTFQDEAGKTLQQVRELRERSAQSQGNPIYQALVKALTRNDAVAQWFKDGVWYVGYIDATASGIMVGFQHAPNGSYEVLHGWMVSRDQVLASLTYIDESQARASISFADQGFRLELYLDCGPLGSNQYTVESKAGSVATAC